MIWRNVQAVGRVRRVVQLKPSRWKAIRQSSMLKPASIAGHVLVNVLSMRSPREHSMAGKVIGVFGKVWRAAR